MSRRNIIILAAAIALGLLAVFLANRWFSGVQQQRTQITTTQEAITKIAVASKPLDFGTQLTQENVRLVDWPKSSVPTGAFSTMDAALQGDRISLRPVEMGEPILAARVSGPDGHASVLASNLPKDMRAVSIPISAVSAVSGFVMPGDTVDVLLTRQPQGADNGDNSVTSVLLENVQVLAIDQIADQKDNKPKVGKTATVLTDLYGAQKLTLATRMGSLSLALRNVENQEVGPIRTVTARDLGGPVYHRR